MCVSKIVNLGFITRLKAYIQREQLLDVGFYYMANAMGRLLGTVLSGFLFEMSGLVLCLWVSAAFIALATLISIGLPSPERNRL